MGREWLTEHSIMAKRLKWCIVNRFPNSDLWGILESFDTESEAREYLQKYLSGHHCGRLCIEQHYV